MLAKRIFFCVFFLVFAYSVTTAQDLRPEDIKDFKVTKLIYKTVGDTELKMDVIYPQDYQKGQKRPAIVFFFGGGWTHGSPVQFQTQGMELAKRGMIAILADYRTVSKYNTTPKECVSDARSAMRYVREHSKEIGVDKKMIAAGGGSAGGHLAAATAVIDAFDDAEDNKRISAVPDALILFNPVIDNGPENGYGYGMVKEYYKDFSPTHNIRSKMPPTLFMVGEKDRLIPSSVAGSFKKRIEEYGGECKLVIYPGQGHGFFNYNKNRNSKYYKETLEETIKFLTAHKFIGGK